MCFPKPCSQEKASLMESWRCSISLFHCLHPQHVRNRAVWILLAKIQRGVGRGDKERAIWSGVFELTSTLSSVFFVTVSERTKSHALSPFLVNMSSPTPRVTYSSLFLSPLDLALTFSEQAQHLHTHNHERRIADTLHFLRMCVNMYNRYLLKPVQVEQSN